MMKVGRMIPTMNPGRSSGLEANTGPYGDGFPPSGSARAFARIAFVPPYRCAPAPDSHRIPY